MSRVEADRDAAADMMGRLKAHAWETVALIQSGSADDGYSVQAFARHRIAAEAKLAEAVEALREIDGEVSHGRLGDWSLALGEIRKTVRTALAKLEPET
jgi:hypothetical protein